MKSLVKITIPKPIRSRASSAANFAIVFSLLWGSLSAQDNVTEASPLNDATILPNEPTIGMVQEEDNNNEVISCRMGHINAWLEQYSLPISDNIGPTVPTNPRTTGESPSLSYRSLVAMRETPRYQTIANDCRYFVEAYNEAAETTCQEEMFNGGSFSGFWTVGPINLDGEWMLAADMVLSNRWQDSRPLVPCADSCYARVFGENAAPGGDCHESATAGTSLVDVTSVTTIEWGNDSGDDSPPLMEEAEIQQRQRILCSLQWFETDRAYQDLRLCASESNVARTMMAEKAASRFHNDAGQPSSVVSEPLRRAHAVARAFAAQREAQAACSERYRSVTCPGLLDESFPFNPSNEKPDSWISNVPDDFGDEMFRGSAGSRATRVGLLVAAVAVLFLLA